MEILFVHGALVRDGQWWWQRAADLLEARTGIRSRAVLLPSCGETTPDDVAGGLVADAAALRAALDEVAAGAAAGSGTGTGAGTSTGTVIVVGHSYGGTVIAEAGTHPAIAHLVYISSYLPDVGLAQGAIMSSETDPVRIADNGDGTHSVDGYDAASFGARFLQDADEETQRAAFSRVTAQAVGAFVTPTTAAGWQGVDSTYLVCADDRSTSVELQRVHAARATRSVELPTGHHPFLSRPDLVVAEIEALLARF